MTLDAWKVLVGAIGTIPSCPPWLKRQAQMSWEASSQLPVLDRTINGQAGAPTVEEELVAPEYLDFLREQIELSARGPEWSAVLRSRLAAAKKGGPAGRGLDAFFKDAGASDPSKAPNWATMQKRHSDKQYFEPASHWSLSPVTDPALRPEPKNDD